MANRVQASSSAATRRRILDAAAGQLSASSTGDFSTRTVCEQAGVAAPTIYHHFGDKDGLIDAVLTEVVEDYLVERRALPVTDDPVADFVRGCRAHVEFGLSRPTVFVTVYGRPDAERRSVAARMSRDYLAEMLQRVETTGRLLVPIDVAADVVNAALCGVVLHLIRYARPIDDPMVALTRDGLMAQIIGAPRSNRTRTVPAPVRSRARTLRKDLGRGLVGTLSDVETAMLCEWLDRLATPVTATQRR